MLRTALAFFTLAFATGSNSLPDTSSSEFNFLLIGNPRLRVDSGLNGNAIVPKLPGKLPGLYPFGSKDFAFRRPIMRIYPPVPTQWVDLTGFNVGDWEEWVKSINTRTERSNDGEIELTTSKMPETTTSELPETTTSELPETTTSELPETTTSELPETTTSELPETTTSELPETTTSELPENNLDNGPDDPSDEGLHGSQREIIKVPEGEAVSHTIDSSIWAPVIENLANVLDKIQKFKGNTNTT